MKSFLIKSALNLGPLKPYGSMLSLNIDSTTKKLTCEILPKGEVTPIQIVIDRYRIEKNETGALLVIESVSVSREWLNVLAQEFLNGKTIPLEGAAATLVPLLL